MTVPLPKYVAVKDKYCIAYYGNCLDYLVQLKLLRPLMEKTYPGIQVYIAFKDNYQLLKDEDRIIPLSKMDNKEFGYVRELRCDLASHPVENFMKESNIPCGPIRSSCLASASKKGVIVQNGLLPTRSMTMDQIMAAKKFLNSKGCTCIEIDGEIDGAGIVIGVESDKLFQAGANGSQVILVPTGFGENLFKSMYPKGQVINF